MITNYTRMQAVAELLREVAVAVQAGKLVDARELLDMAQEAMRYIPAEMDIGEALTVGNYCISTALAHLENTQLIPGLISSTVERLEKAST